MRNTFYPGTSNLHPLAGPQLLGKEHAITAHVSIPESGAEGVLACSGGEFGGWSLFLKGGRLHYVHNYLKIKEYAVASAGPVPAGDHTLGMRFVPTGSHTRPDYFTGDVVLTIDGVQVGKLKDIKMAAQYSSMTGYGLLIGRNTGTPVSHEYAPPFTFTGDLDKVTIGLRRDSDE